ncbi:MAG: sigma 54-interacting transcriptional regulator [Phycisphaerales bacterium]
MSQLAPYPGERVESDPPPARTRHDLKQSGYRYRSVKAELRDNLVRRLRSGSPLFPGVIGYDETVEPQIVNAVLSTHDILLLGLRGQAKTRLLRGLVSLLDEWIPTLEHLELPDDPIEPVTATGQRLVAEHGDDLPVRWLHRSQRFHEKLATPDATIADLIGEIDLVKHAEGRYLSDEETMHFGLIPRANRGLFVMNELPDLPPRIQVGLFNVLEERDVQIRGYPVRLSLDLMLAFSANPEDYTNRGRIVTPLKDRIGSVIRTHYPLNTQIAKQITRENAFIDREGEVVQVELPEIMHELVEELIDQARRSPHINQASGVSARASIASIENLLSSAERRGVMTEEARVMPRMCDLQHVAASCRGKIELLIAEDGASSDGKSTEDRLIDALLGEAVKSVASRYLSLDDLESIETAFQSGLVLRISDLTPAAECVASLRHVEGLIEAAGELANELGMDADDEQALACTGELILEALYVNNRISKTASPLGVSYRR